jgi:hypothetical protein
MTNNKTFTLDTVNPNEDFKKRLEEAIDKMITEPIIISKPEFDFKFTGWETSQPSAQTEEPEKWIWVEGYKGMDENMQGHGGYQFEVGKRYDMPTNVKIQDCRSGFHLSLNMKDVFKHFRIGNGNRFFRVRALVRERDFNNYGEKYIGNSLFGSGVRDKLASQSIEIIRELSVEEVFKDTNWAAWSTEYKEFAMRVSIHEAENMIAVDGLVELGYSKPFATMVVKKGRESIAKAVASQTGLSMDMKALMILEW